MFALEHFFSPLFLGGSKWVKGKKESLQVLFLCHCKKATVESVFNNFNKKHSFQVHFCRLGNNGHRVFLCEFDSFLSGAIYLRTIFGQTKRAKCTQISIIIGIARRCLFQSSENEARNETTFRCP